MFVSTQQNPLSTDAESRTQADNDTARGTESHDDARVDSEQGVFFSDVLRHIMRLISQGREHGVSFKSDTTMEVCISFYLNG